MNVQKEEDLYVRYQDGDGSVDRLKIPGIGTYTTDFNVNSWRGITYDEWRQVFPNWDKPAGENYVAIFKRSDTAYAQEQNKTRTAMMIKPHTWAFARRHPGEEFQIGRDFNSELNIDISLHNNKFRSMCERNSVRRNTTESISIHYSDQIVLFSPSDSFHFEVVDRQPVDIISAHISIPDTHFKTNILFIVIDTDVNIQKSFANFEKSYMLSDTTQGYNLDEEGEAKQKCRDNVKCTGILRSDVPTGTPGEFKLYRSFEPIIKHNYQSNESVEGKLVIIPTTIELDDDMQNSERKIELGILDNPLGIVRFTQKQAGGSNYYNKYLKYKKKYLDLRANKIY